MIQFRIEYRRGARDPYKVIVKCPKCGREGVLRSYRRHSARIFEVSHGKDGKCRFGWSNEFYEIVKETREIAMKKIAELCPLIY